MTAPRSPELGRRQTGGPKLSLGVLSEDSFEKLMQFYAEDYTRIPTVSATATRSAYALEREQLLEAEAQRRARQKQKAAAAAQARIRRWLLQAELDKATWKGVIGGVAVLTRQAPEGLILEALIADSTLPVQWNCPSPRVHLRYPQAPNAAHARFRIAGVPADGGELRVVLRDPEALVTQ